MSTFKNPVGPRSSRVYWRRRVVVLIGLLVVIGVVVFLLVRPGADDAANAPEASPTATPAASESAASGSAQPSDEAEAPIEGAVCDPSVVTVEAVTDTNVYPVGQLPQLSFRIMNTSAAGCEFDFDPTLQSFVITSGEEQYWSSADCQTDEPRSVPMLLEPNVAQTSTPIPWDRTRSSVDTCDTAREAVPGGGATYALTVTVDSVASEPLSFLLN